MNLIFPATRRELGLVLLYGAGAMILTLAPLSEALPTGLLPIIGFALIAATMVGLVLVATNAPPGDGVWAAGREAARANGAIVPEWPQVSYDAIAELPEMISSQATIFAAVSGALGNGILKDPARDKMIAELRAYEAQLRSAAKFSGRVIAENKEALQNATALQGAGLLLGVVGLASALGRFSALAGLPAEEAFALSNDPQERDLLHEFVLIVEARKA